MKFNFSGWSLGGKTIFIATCLAFLSFFFKWVDIGFVSQNGFGQGAVFFIIVFVYPLLMLLWDKPINKIVGYICAVIGVILGIIYISSKSADLFGASVNAASAGPYVFIVSCLILAFGVHRYSTTR